MGSGGVEQVVILCGGRGTRLQGRVPGIPKPLVEVGGRPILWHVVQSYAGQGFRSFLLCTGHRGELIESYARQTPWPPGVEVTCADTGADTHTGGRLHRVRDRLDAAPFCVTYADGVADLDLRALCAGHAAGGTLATMTVVRPQLQFGVAVLGANDLVTAFHEKPRSKHWVNGGFFVFSPSVLDLLTDASVLERAPLERLAADRQLRAHRHAGFWACVDTHKDVTALDELWAAGAAPWRTWDRERRAP